MTGMKILNLPRRGGKTTAMLSWMREAPEGEHRIFVAFSAHEAMRVYRIARGQEGNELESWQFVGASEARAGDAWSAVLAYRGGRIVLGFDNLDLWLATHFGREVTMATVNAEEKHRPAHWPPPCAAYGQDHSRGCPASDTYPLDGGE